MCQLVLTRARCLPRASSRVTYTRAETISTHDRGHSTYEGDRWDRYPQDLNSACGDCMGTYMIGYQLRVEDPCADTNAAYAIEYAVTW